MQVAVIGGGPAGAVAAARLAIDGHSVDLYEAQVFPRFRIGESLLPCSMPILASIGIDAAWWRALGAVYKPGASFELADGSAVMRVDFAEALPGDPEHAWQVERAPFDAALLDVARARGVQVHQPCRVTAVDVAGARPVLQLGDTRREFDFVIDASGRETLLARHHDCKDTVGDLRRGAVYGHVSDLAQPDGSKPGDISICMDPSGWAWQIPIAGQRMSVGLVLEREALQVGGGPEAIFRAGLERFPALAQRLDGRVPEPLRTTPNISYRVRQRYGRGWATIGDGGGFVDPIFSSGVHLGVTQGSELAAALAAGPEADLSAWSAQCDRDLQVFTSFIRLWYQHRTLKTLFFAPSRNPAIVAGITSVLAGNTRSADNLFLQMLNRRDQASQAEQA
ncbi:MAG: tryptophan 7-halogenase [Planctomycetota bacterium]|jgi:flavin-dependent dehydrogenase|nr:tryptophan 7-halogenase [Planctomycetota bacterium]